MNKTKISEANKAIGKAIAKCRKTAGLSQEEVAEKLKIGNESVSRMERGIVMPIPLAEILSIKRKKLHIDHNVVQCLLDEAKNVETPAQRRERLQKRVNELKVNGQRNFLAQTAKEEGVSTARLKAILESAKNQNKVQKQSPLTALLIKKTDSYKNS